MRVLTMDRAMVDTATQTNEGRDSGKRRAREGEGRAGDASARAGDKELGSGGGAGCGGGKRVAR